MLSRLPHGARHSGDESMPSTLLSLELSRNVYGRLLRDAMAVTGMDPREALVLRMLLLNAEVSVRDVRFETRMPPSTVSSVVNRLVDDGLVRRYRAMGDRRQVWLELTRVGLGVALMLETAIVDVGAGLGSLVEYDLSSVNGLAAALHERSREPRMDAID